MDPINPGYGPADSSCDDTSGAPPPPPPSPAEAERAAREQATATYNALASGEDCSFTEGKFHDFDRCVIENAGQIPLFLRAPGDVDDVTSADVHQHRVGDCALMATLAAMAGTPAGRALIKGAIVENTNDRGVVTSYTVTLHKPETHWYKATTFSDVKITVSPLLTLGHASGQANGTGELWPAVIEKACAQYIGGYNVLNTGTAANIPMQLLTGRPAQYFPLHSYGADQLKSALAAGKLVVFETKSAFCCDNPYGLVDAHAYSVTGTETKNGQLWVTLHNPWGNKDTEPNPIPYSQFKRWFSGVDVGSMGD